MIIVDVVLVINDIIRPPVLVMVATAVPFVAMAAMRVMLFDVLFCFFGVSSMLWPMVMIVR